MKKVSRCKFCDSPAHHEWSARKSYTVLCSNGVDCNQWPRIYANTKAQALRMWDLAMAEKELFTAVDAFAVRDKSGVGLEASKDALRITEGDVPVAIEFLRFYGQAIAVNGDKKEWALKCAREKLGVEDGS